MEKILSLERALGPRSVSAKNEHILTLTERLKDENFIARADLERLSDPLFNYLKELVVDKKYDEKVLIVNLNRLPCAKKLLEFLLHRRAPDILPSKKLKEYYEDKTLTHADMLEIIKLMFYEYGNRKDYNMLDAFLTNMRSYQLSQIIKNDINKHLEWVKERNQELADSIFVKGAEPKKRKAPEESVADGNQEVKVIKKKKK